MGRISIKADREYIREVFKKIDDKEYAVPVFQRDYVWKQKQIIDLFDSISKGYPIGSLVLWESKEIKKSKDLLTDEILQMPSPNYYILDGRQRLTTLYGCISQRNDKKPEFYLYYNLRTQTFEYPKVIQSFHMLVSDLYDTFSLLGALDKLKESDLESATFMKYLNRAKKMNSILQEYVIGEIKIAECALSEASIVFNRINSKGTLINSIDMLQATSYKNDSGIVLQDKIKIVTDRLKPYGFENIGMKEVLNCCFWVIGNKYFDSKIEDLGNEDLDIILPKVADSLEKTVQFLRDYCYVLSPDFLPYKNQLMAISWFFLSIASPSYEQIVELRRWFFYTSVLNLFQNGSLSNVRQIFGRFESFIKGQKTTAYEYQDILMPEFDVPSGRATATSKLLVSIYLYEYMKSARDNMVVSFFGYYYPFDKMTIIGRVPKFTAEEGVAMAKIRSSSGMLNVNLDGYGLDSSTINAIIVGDNVSYLSNRLLFVKRIVSELFKEIGIKITDMQGS